MCYPILSICRILYVWTLIICSQPILYSEQNDEEFCQTLKNLGKFYDSPDFSGLQSANLFLSYQHQLGYIHGEDQNGQSFDDDFEEFRRFWVGLSGRFATRWKFKVVSQLSNDRNAYPGDYRQWGHETFRAANLTYDADPFWNGKYVNSMQLGYGRRTGRMADEWQRSSTVINCLERSSFANKLWLYDKEKGNPLAGWMKWSASKHTFDLALFSGTYDDYLGGWEDSLTYYLSWLGDYSENSSMDLLEYWISFYKQDGSRDQDHLAGGMDWALSLVNRIGKNRLALHSTLALGSNGNRGRDGSDKSLSQQGDFHGIALMPMYWILKDKLKLVWRSVHQRADRKEGLQLNSRYVPIADARDETIDLSAGRGDRHDSHYLGLNYYLCGENLKFVNGIQYEDLKSEDRRVFKGWTMGSSFRIWF